MIRLHMGIGNLFGSVLWVSSCKDMPRTSRTRQLWVPKELSREKWSSILITCCWSVDRRAWPTFWRRSTSSWEYFPASVESEPVILRTTSFPVLEPILAEEHKVIQKKSRLYTESFDSQIVERVPKPAPNRRLIEYRWLRMSPSPAGCRSTSGFGDDLPGNPAAKKRRMVDSIFVDGGKRQKTTSRHIIGLSNVERITWVKHAFVHNLQILARTRTPQQTLQVPDHAALTLYRALHLLDYRKCSKGPKVNTSVRVHKFNMAR